MNKSLSRLVSLLLVSCLVIDPTSATACSIRQSPAVALATAPVNLRINEQALISTQLFYRDVLQRWPSLRYGRHLASAVALAIVLTQARQFQDKSPLQILELVGLLLGTGGIFAIAGAPSPEPKKIHKRGPFKNITTLGELVKQVEIEYCQAEGRKIQAVEFRDRVRLGKVSDPAKLAPDDKIVFHLSAATNATPTPSLRTPKRRIFPPSTPRQVDMNFEPMVTAYLGDESAVDASVLKSLGIHDPVLFRSLLNLAAKARAKQYKDPNVAIETLTALGVLPNIRILRWIEDIAAAGSKSTGLLTHPILMATAGGLAGSELAGPFLGFLGVLSAIIALIVGVRKFIVFRRSWNQRAVYEEILQAISHFHYNRVQTASYALARVMQANALPSHARLIYVLDSIRSFHEVLPSVSIEDLEIELLFLMGDYQPPSYLRRVLRLAMGLDWPPFEKLSGGTTSDSLKTPPGKNGPPPAMLRAA